MANPTRQLPKNVNLIQWTKDKWTEARSRHGILPIFGFGFILLLILAVSLAAIRPLGSGDTQNLGRWENILNTDDANQIIDINYNRSTGTVSLSENSESFSYILNDETKQKLVRAHMNRFNRSVRGKRYDSALVPRDCIFRLDLDQLQSQGPRLEVVDLSPFNSYPKGERKARNLGSIYMRPTNTPLTYMSDGVVSLFLQPDMTEENTPVNLLKPGLYSGKSLILTDPQGNARATFSSIEDGNGVRVSGQRGQLFVDNNAPEADTVTVGKGQLVEVAGRFFETRIEESMVLATSAASDRGAKRLYPMGSNLQFVGPTSLRGSFQSLGLEYMFQEYLEGNPELDIPPGAIWLTLEPRLQGLLSESVQQLALHSKQGIVSGLMMDAHTGAILAMAAQQRPDQTYDPGNMEQVRQLLDSGNDRFANHGCFKRHVIGSVTKSFFAFLALNEMEGVENLVVRSRGDKTSKLFGHRLYGDPSREFKITYPNPGFDSYLINSSNLFQHTLGTLMLAGVTDLNEIPDTWYTRVKGVKMIDSTKDQESLELGTMGVSGTNKITIPRENPYATKARQLFDLETAGAAGRANDRDISIYGGLIGMATRVLQQSLPEVDAEQLLLRRSAVCAPEFPRTEWEEVSDTALGSILLFGANRNRWTDVKLCESFSRMITGRKVKANLVYKYLNTLEDSVEVIQEAQAEPFAIPDEVRSEQVFNKLRQRLERVPTIGTGKIINPALKEIRNIPEFRRFKLFGKTGTIDDGKPDSKLFVGTFGLWNEAQNAFESNAVTFAFYLKNATDEDALVKMIRNNLKSWWLTAYKPLDESS